MSDNKPQPSIKELQQQVADLQAKLLDANSRTELAEAVARAAASPDAATGRSIKVSRCLNPTETDKKLQSWEEVDVPTFMYRVELPTGAGVHLTRNGVQYYHGQEYELDYYTLVDVKSMVARTWDHERSIHGDNENAYRKQTQRRF